MLTIEYASAMLHLRGIINEMNNNDNNVYRESFLQLSLPCFIDKDRSTFRTTLFSFQALQIGLETTECHN